MGYHTTTMGQKMKKISKGVLLSKKEVQKYIESGEAIYDSVQSAKDNLAVYRFADGRLLYKRDDGKGALWQSENQIDSVMEKAISNVSILNLKGWITEETDLNKLKQSAINILQKKIGKNIDYSSESLEAVNKIKIKDVVRDKELLYAVIVFSCVFYEYNYDGKIEKELIHGQKNYYRPIVKTSAGKNYLPYSEYLKSFSEPPLITIKQSIEIEHDKYKLYKK